MIPGESKILPVIDNYKTINYKLKLPDTLFGVNYNLFFNNSGKLSCDRFYGTSIIGEKDRNIIYSIYNGLPHSSLNHLCLGMGHITTSVNDAYNYYWRSNFLKYEFGPYYIFNKKHISLKIHYPKNGSPDNILKNKFEFIKHGKEVLITNNKKFKNKAIHILNMEVSKVKTSRPFEFYVL